VELWDLLVNNLDLPDPITSSDEIITAGKASMHCQILYLDNNNFHYSAKGFHSSGESNDTKRTTN
jgi:hypothetical protein